MFPKFEPDPEAEAREASWRSSKSRNANTSCILERMLKNIRNPNNDPAVIELSKRSTACSTRSKS